MLAVNVPFLETPDDDAEYVGAHTLHVRLTGEHRLALHRVRAGLIDAGADPAIDRENVVLAVMDAIVAAIP
jgi:hypothetical protein